MSRLSIFSFETLDLHDSRWSRILLALTVGLGLVVTTEAATRWLLAGVGRRWEFWHPEAAATFEAYRQRVAAGPRADVAVIGDSTAHCNFDREVLQQTLGPGRDVWNLAWDGNFADAFAKSTLPLLAEGRFPPRVVVFSMTPAGFIKRPLRTSEAAILNCPYCRRQDSTTLIEDVVHVARIWPALPVLVSDWRGDALHKAAETRGFAPKQGLLSDRVAGRDEVPVSASAVVLDERRIEVLMRLAGWAQRNDVRLIVVIPPTKDEAAWRASSYAAYRHLIQQKSRELGFDVFDGMQGHEYPTDYFADLNHLNQRGARQFTRELAGTLVLRDRVAAQQADTTPLVMRAPASPRYGRPALSLKPE